MRFLLLFLSLLPAGSAVAGGTVDLSFACPPGLLAHKAILGQPGVLAVALENAGVPYKINSRLLLFAPDRCVIKSPNYDIRISCQGRKGEVHDYLVQVNGPLVTLGRDLDLTVRLDAARMADGLVTVSILPPLGGLLPDFLLEPVRVKADLARQLDLPGRLLAYLDGLAASAPGVAQDFAVLQDACNRGRPAGSLAPQPGDAGPLSDSAIFFGTLLVWCAGFPALVWAAWRLRRPTAP